MNGERRAWYICKRVATVTHGRNAYFTKVKGLCGREVEPERATEVDDRVSCPDCIIKICEELRAKTARICAKIRKE